MPDDSPFAYEEVFSLILSLTQQVLEDKEKGTRKQETMENYFIRLTKWALGEYEFARRMGFDGIPVVRIAPYRVLWTYYGQRAPEDFIFQYKEERCCVDVKFYDSFRMLHRIEIPEYYVKGVQSFQHDFHLDRAFLAIKRFERWYLLDADKVSTLPKNQNRHIVEIDWARSNHEILDEQHVFFNIGRLVRPIGVGASSEEIRWHDAMGRSLVIKPPSGATKNGVDLRKIDFNHADKIAKFEFSLDMETQATQPTEVAATEYSIFRNLLSRIQENFRTIMLRDELKNKLSNVIRFEDLCPTVFTICDELPELQAKEASVPPKELAFQKGLRNLENANYVLIGQPDKVAFYVAKYFMIVLHDLREER